MMHGDNFVSLRCHLHVHHLANALSKKESKQENEWVGLYTTISHRCQKMETIHQVVYLFVKIFANPPERPLFSLFQTQAKKANLLLLKHLSLL